MNAERRRFAALSVTHRPEFSVFVEDNCFYFNDRTGTTGFDRHYVYHTSWAARQLAGLKPTEHVDISSSMFFVGIASAIVPMRHLDYRPPIFSMSNVECGAGDLMKLPFEDASVSSLSCMHVVEHVGLGRYGDPLDPCGDIKACHELSRVLTSGGNLLFVVPVGRPRVCFNAHRIYSIEMVRALFPDLELAEWALLSDDEAKGLIENPPNETANCQDYGCGCFRFVKA
jgi:SAM-dependent methyltransferase